MKQRCYCVFIYLCMYARQNYAVPFLYISLSGCGKHPVFYENIFTLIDCFRVNFGLVSLPSQRIHYTSWWCLNHIIIRIFICHFVPKFIQLPPVEHNSKHAFDSLHFDFLHFAFESRGIIRTRGIFLLFFFDSNKNSPP